MEETQFSSQQYCTEQLVPNREAKDTYHPLLVSAYALDGAPPGIACCNASRQQRPDPALVRPTLTITTNTTITTRMSWRDLLWCVRCDVAAVG